MATNDDYQSSYAHNNTYNSYGNQHGRREDAAFPPPPPHSPFDDQQYSYPHMTPSQSHSGASGRTNHDTDPFDDGNAIPLNGRKYKHDSTASVAPILQPPPDDDHFVRDAKYGRRRRHTRQRSAEGWFRGKITWCCYVLTVVQLIVFVAQLVKNGKLYTVLHNRSHANPKTQASSQKRPSKSTPPSTP